MSRIAVLPAPLAADVEARALEGDADAWGQLAKRHEHRVLVSLLARGVPLEEARDLVQETWADLLKATLSRKLARLDMPGLAVTHAQLLLGKRARRHRVEVKLGLVGEAPHGTVAPVPVGQAPPDARLGAAQSLARLEAVLADCPPAARAVFEYVYAHPDVEYRAIASQFGLSHQRIKQIVCEVRARLRRALEEDPS